VFTWWLDRNHPDVDGLRAGLVAAGAGRPIPDLEGTTPVLVVSVEEYDRRWWEARS
jgi:hypothetical protein